jgi:hypothetical protein
MLRYPTTAINDSWRCFAISHAEDRLYKQMMELKDGFNLAKPDVGSWSRTRLDP